MRGAARLRLIGTSRYEVMRAERYTRARMA
jgi:hypothetical protein